MNTVFCLYYEGYEGDFLIQIFSTSEKAMTYVTKKRLSKKDHRLDEVEVDSDMHCRTWWPTYYKDDMSGQPEPWPNQI